MSKDRFTPREMEAAALIAQGLTFVQMGEQMGISPRTARMYSDTLRDRLGVDKKHEIVPEMKRLGLLPKN